MTCEEFLDLLDGDPPLPTEAEAHMASCPSCAQAADREEAARRGLAALREVATPEDLHTKILAASVRPAPGHFGRRSQWAAPLAAALLLALLGGVTLVRLFRSSPLPEEGLSRPTVRAPQPAVERNRSGEFAEPQGDSSKREQTTPPREGDGRSEALPAPPPRPMKAQDFEISQDLVEVHRKGEAKAAEEESPAFRQASAPSPTGAPTSNADENTVNAPSTVPGAPARLAPQPPALFSAGDIKSRGAEDSLPEAAAVPAPAPLVLCSLQTLDRSRYASLQLPEDSAPPPGTQWFVVVGESGVRSVVDEKGRPLEAVLETVAAGAQYLHLPPGRYKLRRLAE
jgi:hypothetical protein